MSVAEDVRIMAEDLRMYEAILCALIRRSGGEIRLPVREVVTAGNGYRFCVEPDHGAGELILTNLSQRPKRPPRRRRS